MIEPVLRHKLANLLLHFAVRTKFSSIIFDSNHLEMISFCAEMLEQSHVQVIHIEPRAWTTITEMKEITDL